MRGLDKDCDSTIDLEEFASRFAPVFTRLNMKQDVSERLPVVVRDTGIVQANTIILHTASMNNERYIQHSTIQVFCPVENSLRTCTSLKGDENKLHVVCIT